MFLLRPTAEQLCVGTCVWVWVCVRVCERWRAWKTGRKRNDILTLPHMLLHGDLWMYGVMDSKQLFCLSDSGVKTLLLSICLLLVAKSDINTIALVSLLAFILVE